MLIRAIDANPIVSEAALSKIMDSSVDALKRRVRRLRERGVLFDVPIVSRDCSVFKKRAVVALNIEKQAFASENRQGFQNYHELVRFLYNELLKTEAWAQARRRYPVKDADARIEAVFSVHGTVDVFVVIAATDAELISILVEDVVGKIKGVSRSVTFFVTEWEILPASLKSCEEGAGPLRGSPKSRKTKTEMTRTVVRA